MLTDDRLMSVPARKLAPSFLVAARRLTMVGLVAFGCGGGPSVGTSGSTAVPSTGDRSVDGLLAIPEERVPIDDPDATLLDQIESMMGTYPIGGAWASPPSELDFSPKSSSFEGELVVTRREGDLIQIGSHGAYVEAPVLVGLRTEDGALAESVEGTVLLTNRTETDALGNPVPFRAELSAVVDLRTLSGSFSVADDPTFTFREAALNADLTPFGTRGTLNATLEMKEPPELGPNEMAVAPGNHPPLLSWNGGQSCVGESGPDPELSLYPAPTQARRQLEAAIAEVGRDTYLAKYADGTETRIGITLEPLSALCATDFWASYWHFVTRAHLRTDDGRIDVSIAVTLDPGFAQLHYNTLTEEPWAFPPSLAAEQIGVMDTSLEDYAHVGIESWFDLVPEATGWVKVLGYPDGACQHCEAAGGCTECAWDERVEVLNLFIGTAANEL